MERRPVPDFVGFTWSPGPPALPPNALTDTDQQLALLSAVANRQPTPQRDTRFLPVFPPSPLSPIGSIQTNMVLSPLDMLAGAVANTSPLKRRDMMFGERADMVPQRLQFTTGQGQANVSAMPVESRSNQSFATMSVRARVAVAAAIASAAASAGAAPPTLTMQPTVAECGYVIAAGKKCTKAISACTTKCHRVVPSRPRVGGVKRPIPKSSGIKGPNPTPSTGHGHWSPDKVVSGSPTNSFRPKLVIAMHWNSTNDQGSVYNEQLVQLAAVACVFTQMDASTTSTSCSSSDLPVMEVSATRLNGEFVGVFHTDRRVVTPGLVEHIEKYEGAETANDGLSRFWDWVAARSRESPGAEVVFAKHSAFTQSNALISAHGRAGLNFVELSKKVLAWVDTYQLCRNLPVCASGCSLAAIANTLRNPVEPLDVLGNAGVTASLLMHAGVRQCFMDPTVVLGRRHVAHVAYITSCAASNASRTDKRAKKKAKVQHTQSKGPKTAQGAEVETKDAGVENSSDDGESGEGTPSSSSTSEEEAFDFAGTDFQWEEVEPQVGPVDSHTRDYAVPPASTPFKTRNPGPHENVRPDMTELDIWLLLWPLTTFALMVVNTNLYAAQQRRCKWVAVQSYEMIGFVGCILYMAAKGLDRANAWAPAPWGDPYLKTVMAERRFSDIWQCLHFVNNAAVDKATRAKDRFWRISVLIHLLNAAFLFFYIPLQWLSVDEMTVAFEGRHGAKQ